jgi:hypothetical protein
MWCQVQQKNRPLKTSSLWNKKSPSTRKSYSRNK